MHNIETSRLDEVHGVAVVARRKQNLARLELYRYSLACQMRSPVTYLSPVICH